MNREDDVLKLLLRRVLPVALALGLAHWVLDALFLYLGCRTCQVAVPGHESLSFMGALITDVPPLHLALRTGYVALWLAGGVLLAWYMHRRVRMLERLRERQQHLLLQFEAAGDLFSRHAADGTVLYASPACREVLGVAPADLVGRRTPTAGLAVIGADDLARRWRDLVTRGDADRLDVQIQRGDGKIVWLETVAHVGESADVPGQPEVVCVSRDVTASRETSRALNESEQRLRYITEGMREIVWLRSRDEILYLNPAFESVTGLPRDVIMQQGLTVWLDMAHHEDRETLAGALKAAIERFSALDHEFRIVRPDGDVRWLHARTVLVDTSAEGRPLVVGVAEDITERKQAEAALRDSDAIYRNLFAAAHLGIAITTRDGRLRFANPAMAEMLGYADVQSMTREVNAAGGVAIVHNDGQQRHALIQRLFGSAEGWTRMTGELRRADGSLFAADISASLAANPVTGEQEIYSFLQDITQRHELEVQLRQAQKMEAVGRLAGAVAHEFSNLLQVIQGYAELLERSFDEDSAGAEAIGHISAASSSAIELVRQLLTYSRRESINPQVVDLDHAVAALVRLLASVLGPGIRVEVHKTPDLAPVYADPRQMEQVLMNLVLNARDALPGEGTVTIETANFEIDQAFRITRPWARPGRYVRVSVRDDGCGIPIAARDHVYEPFYTTKGFGYGTGLGLATAYSIMKQHQGYIDFESELDRGTVFTIYLPVMAVTVAEPAVTGTASGPRGHGELILLVDDDDLIRHLTTHMLEDAGYEVIAARDGEDALELFMAHAAEVKLLMLDVVMPRMDGRALFENIRELKPAVPVLFCSGHPASVLESEYMFKVTGDLLQKPFRAHELLTRVRAILDR